VDDNLPTGTKTSLRSTNVRRSSHSSLALLLLQLKKEKRLKDLPFLVYQYGQEEDSPSDAYSLVRANAWVPYKEGMKRRYDQPPHHIQDKLILGQDLNDEDKLTLEPLRKMKQDQAKNPADRHGGFPVPFLECYDLITDSPAPKKELDIKIGTHIAVYWEGENDWYEAEVMDIRHDFYFLRYAVDEDEEWLPLAEHPFRILNVQEIQKKQMFRCISTDPEDAEDEKRVASSKRSTPDKVERPHSRKSFMETGDSSTGSPQPSPYLLERVLNDGSIHPKKKPRRLSNGTYARPKGRHPLNMSWDNQKGIWVPKSRRTKQDPDHTLMVERKRAPEQRPSSPLKKRKVKDFPAPTHRLKSSSDTSFEEDRKGPVVEKGHTQRNSLEIKKEGVMSSQKQPGETSSARLKSAPSTDSSSSIAAEVDGKLPAIERKQSRRSSLGPKKGGAMSSPVEKEHSRRSSLDSKKEGAVSRKWRATSSMYGEIGSFL